ncbi:hypothetical protein NQK81_33890 [Amycolatopsis roodepoortensis]|uniref:hypothetical protein n=1 Tax=Amycolatopsis roodepoortensis TaxID=700274 RepID=UPI00214C5578|nr:hypothetical protein [Amycolatopsis roodepoortensis]UUV29721.1 hypothetical protein NQK81_33890 [Amycolatopsis roodepoortensis]
MTDEVVGLTVTVTGGGTEVDGVAVTVVTGVDVIAGVGFGGWAVQAEISAKSPEITNIGQRLMASSARVTS